MREEAACRGAVSCGGEGVVEGVDRDGEDEAELETIQVGRVDSAPARSLTPSSHACARRSSTPSPSPPLSPQRTKPSFATPHQPPPPHVVASAHSRPNSPSSSRGPRRPTEQVIIDGMPSLRSSRWKWKRCVREGRGRGIVWNEGLSSGLMRSIWMGRGARRRVSWVVGVVVVGRRRGGGRRWWKG